MSNVLKQYAGSGCAALVCLVGLLAIAYAIAPVVGASAQDETEQPSALQVRLHAFDDGWLLHAPMIFAVSVHNPTEQPHWFNGRRWIFRSKDTETGESREVKVRSGCGYNVCEHVPVPPGETRVFLISATAAVRGVGQGEWGLQLVIPTPVPTAVELWAFHPTEEPADLVRQTAPILSDRLRIRIEAPRTKVDRDAARMMQEHVTSLDPDAGNVFGAGPDFEPPTKLVHRRFWSGLRIPRSSGVLPDWEKLYAAHSPEEGFPGLAGLLIRAKHPASAYARAVVTLVLLGVVEKSRHNHGDIDLDRGDLELDRPEDAAIAEACEELFADLAKRWPEYARGDLVSYLRIHFDLLCGRWDQGLAGAGEFALVHPDSPLRPLVDQLIDQR